VGQWLGEDGDRVARWLGDDGGLQAGVRDNGDGGALQKATSSRQAVVQVLQADGPGGGGVEAATSGSRGPMAGR
jgi:hypothetical protein